MYIRSHNVFISDEPDEATKKMEEWRKDWKEKEAEIRKEILEQEKAHIIHYEKIKSFKGFL